VKLLWILPRLLRLNGHDPANDQATPGPPGVPRARGFCNNSGSGDAGTCQMSGNNAGFECLGNGNTATTICEGMGNSVGL
jgi:hypothetical protein